jgi:hypothetical protein
MRSQLEDGSRVSLQIGGARANGAMARADDALRASLADRVTE